MVEGLASLKKLPVSFLRGLGVHDIPGGGVSIPYRDLDGSDLFVRERGTPACNGKPFDQAAGVKLQPGGLDRLDSARRAGWLILVEGESDCWALWEQGVPALGIPGSNSFRVLTAEHLDGLHTVYVSQESDQAGKTFSEKVPAHLQELGYSGKVFVLDWPEGCKDPGDLYADDPVRFLERLMGCIQRARQVEPEEPDVLPLQNGKVNANKAPASDDDAHLTDKGNAARLVSEHGNDLRHCFPWGKWLDWTGNRWRLDDTGEAARRATQTTASLFSSAMSEMALLHNLMGKEK